ncbi:DNA-methyltransferase [Spiroplasma corruscae]|uniref:Cytosine-specific methyltransferase n=1 Tax=Spiroplasma corruscae TaxID=216934 RepID=A0A222EQD7_9MOLU|nr:DNA (cytosine-5-)-methyltransferase [Spiroplasma corruscae]ASP28453.1 DNA-methyltransferase [Spiroplasma corruscae]
MNKISVVELFAGVGGFRLGMTRYNDKLFDFVFANQWEPNKKVQHAFDCYVHNFGSENAVNLDIKDCKYDIPFNHDLLVGGFPCQDYSVASTNAKGIEGKKGVLWWEISWILENKQPKMVLLENVDRLLKSPSKQRGRDFAIMLKNFDKLGYDVEWQVINAADYGMVQRRKRVFIFAKNRLFFDNNIKINEDTSRINNGFFDKEFPSLQDEKTNLFIDLNSFTNEVDITHNYQIKKFLNKGFCYNGRVFCYDFKPICNNKLGILKTILENKVDLKYYLNEYQLGKMKYLKSGKKILRYKPNGEVYNYTEGSMSLFDSVEKPARTLITSEGTLNRSTHIIKKGEFYRFITPLEAERINGFDDNWTECIKTERMRYFCMGNALVVSIIEKLSKSIEDSFNIINKTKLCQIKIKNKIV